MQGREEQNKIAQVVQAHSRRGRASWFELSNRRRKPAVLNVGNYVPVSRKRFKQLEEPKGATKDVMWYCPYLVHLPPHGALLIRAPGNGAPPPSKSSPYAIIYNPRAETKHTSKVYDAAPLNDSLGELIGAVIFVLMNHGCFTKLGPLPGLNFFTSIP